MPAGEVAEKPRLTKCSTCGGEFDLEQGGCAGVIGTFITVAFCVWCRVGIFEMVEQQLKPCECKCGNVFGLYEDIEEQEDKHD